MLRKFLLVVGLVTVLPLSLQAKAIPPPPTPEEATSADSSATAAEAKPLAGYDNGFKLRSADDAFNLQISTRLQFQHLYQDIRSSTATDTNSFRMRRARMTLLGKLFEKYSFTFQFGPTSNGAAPAGMFWYADMTATIIPEFQVQVGTLSLPYDRNGETSSGNYAFVEAPITGTQEDGGQNGSIGRQAFSGSQSLGIRLLGDISKFHYIVGVTHGGATTWNEANSGRALAYGARVWYDILGESTGSESDLGYSDAPNLSFGAGAMFDPKDAVELNAATGLPTTRMLNWALNASGDAAFQWHGFTLLTEAYFRKIKVTPGNFTLDDFGYYAQAGYFVVPKKLEFVARGAQIFREGPDNNAYEFAGGLNWYIEGKKVKLQTDFSRLLDYDATVGTGGLATNRFRTMLTFQI